MPKAFNKCVKDGGKVWTEKSDKNHYQHFCSFGGKVVAGEVKKVKAKGKK